MCFGASFHDVRYGAGREAMLDLDTPAGAGPFLTIVAVHGGGWSGGSREDAAAFCRTIVEHQWACASIDYRLAPATRFPGQVEDVKAAIMYLTRNAARYGIDGGAVILAGESAGGHLVSWLGAAHPPELPVRGVIVFSAPQDLEALAEPGRDLAFVPPEIRDLLNAPDFTPASIEKMREASPSFRIRPGTPPFVIFHGERDALVPLAQGSAFCAKLREAGGNCEWHVIPEARHGLWREDEFQRFSPGWLPFLEAWIARTTQNYGNNH